MQSLMQLMRNLGPMRLAAMAGVTIGLLGFMIFFATRLAAPQMELLYGDLDQTDSRQIVSKLGELGVPYDLREGGTQVYVPADKVLPMRLRMAELALPSGGSIGYEVFDQQDTLGTTSFMQNVNMVRALEGELARTIRSIDGVRTARVHLVLPRREMFSRETQEPSASIVIGMSHGQLASSQVTAIQYLVAAAVPRLDPTKISVIDERGRLLARGGDSEQNLLAQTTEEMRSNYQQRLARSIEALLARSLGPDKVRAEVNAELDFDRVVTNEEIFDADNPVVRSNVIIEEEAQTEDSEPDPVTVGQNIPDADFNTFGAGRSVSRQARTEETTNFEISRRVVNQVRETGVVRRLSVAVLVDGTYQTGEDGQRVYQPRGEDEMNQIGALVRSAIGYDGSRGDQVEIINMRFTDIDDIDVTPEFMFLGFTKDELMRIAEGLGVSIVAILVILLVVRPLVTRAFESLPAAGEAAGRQLLTEQAGVAALPGAPPGMAPAPEELDDELIDISKVEGRVKASSLRKIGEIVEHHPEEALGIIRSWMYQESG